MRVQISVRDVMSEAVLTAFPTESVLSIVEKMRGKNAGSVIVVEDGKPSGIVTERDIAFKVVGNRRDPERTSCSEIMTHPVATIDASVDLTEAADIMRKNNFRRLPVVEDGTLVGIITEKDIAEIEPDIIRLLQSLLAAKDLGAKDSISKHYQESKAREEFERIKNRKKPNK